MAEGEEDVLELLGLVLKSPHLFWVILNCLWISMSCFAIISHNRMIQGKVVSPVLTSSTSGPGNLLTFIFPDIICSTEYYQYSIKIRSTEFLIFAKLNPKGYTGNMQADWRI